jgi:hypothetical protein
MSIHTTKNRKLMLVNVEIYVDITEHEEEQSDDMPASYECEISFDEEKLIELARAQLKEDFTNNQ